METVEMMGTGWAAGLPLLHLAGFVLAFLAGGLVTRTLSGRKPEARRATAAPARPVTTPGSAGQVFGHEMKNYLCALRGNAYLLRLASQDKSQADIIDRIDQVVSRIEGLDWKEEAAPDIIGSKTHECLDLASVAQACSRLHFNPAATEFRFDSNGVEALIEGDPQRMEQVFQNLYRNSLEAGATRLFTRFRRIGNALEISVEDNGRGCSPESARRIFEPFYSTKTAWGPDGESAAKAPSKAAPRGLGLFIAQSIVENHLGRIRASSKNGRGDGETGLVVYLHLPLFAGKGRQDKRPLLTSLRPKRLPLAAAT